MNNTGWIKIYRSLLYWEWADVPEMVALWVRLIIRATHEDTQWHGVTISRGHINTDHRYMGIRFYFEADREIWMPKFKKP